MTRSRLLVGVIIASLAAAVVLWFMRDDDGDVRGHATAQQHDDDNDGSSGSSGGGGGAAHASPRSPGQAAPEGSVVISGWVIDSQEDKPVPNVEVVFRSAAGEETTTAAEDGTWRIVVPRGSYRAFVRDDTVLTIGRMERVRVPGLPQADNAGAPEESVMPIVEAQRDVTDVELRVVRGGVISGKVLDRAGKPIAKAVLRARSESNVRPALGTDIAETDANGQFELRVPSGMYVIEATHPRYAGVAQRVTAEVDAGDHLERDVTLTAGCVVVGRVIAADGKAANDGAIEIGDEGEFRPDGKIQPDGTFRWATTAEEAITLRAWPWKSPPSDPRSFECHDGAYYNVVFQLSKQSADIEGLLVDATGAPVPLAFIDLRPLDPGGIPQQERTDVDGKWGVFSMPAGHYQVTAYAPERGVVMATVESPSTNVRLALGGTGRIEGTAPMLKTGNLEVRFASCTIGGGAVAINDETRLVSVTNGRFQLDNVPACELAMQVSWQSHHAEESVDVAANGVGHIELLLGPPRPRHVRGMVKDDAGRPVADVFVEVTFEGGESSTRTDDTGHYEFDTFAGARVSAIRGRMSASGEVPTTGGDNVAVDLVLAEVPESPDEGDFE